VYEDIGKEQAKAGVHQASEGQYSAPARPKPPRREETKHVLVWAEYTRWTKINKAQRGRTGQCAEEAVKNAKNDGTCTRSFSKDHAGKMGTAGARALQNDRKASAVESADKRGVSGLGPSKPGPVHKRWRKDSGTA